jgi:hypothetical protein
MVVDVVRVKAQLRFPPGGRSVMHVGVARLLLETLPMLCNDGTAEHKADFGPNGSTTREALRATFATFPRSLML